jgi:hypothetical protein
MNEPIESETRCVQRLEEWLSGVTDVLRELPQVSRAASAHLWNLRADYYNAKPPNTPAQRPGAITPSV